MEITTTFYAKNRTAWRTWLKKHHATKGEIWLVYYNKSSGKPRVPYNDAVEEALCFGWIDSIIKKIDTDSFAQRFTPRKPKSVWSEMNKERVRRLIREKKMTPAGLAAFNGSAHRSVLKTGTKVRAEKLVIPSTILKALKRNPATWKNFQKFPESYKRIRIGWIEGARHRPKIFRQRLSFFLKMTAQNKRYGMVQ